ncbi:MAG: hypothetical protein KJN99_12240 [Marinicaulis sp.]|nr:hypothetical protein [Marinicaulis sp.]
MLRTLVVVATFSIAACDGVDMEQMQVNKLASMELTATELEVANALIEGYKKEMGSMLRSREIARAACYAKSVEMPSQWHRVHKAYIADYTAIDDNFYPWFASKGIGEQTAWDIGQRVVKGYEACSVGSLLKKRFSDK